MIRNERQYKITRAQVGRFKRALAKHAGVPRDKTVHPILHKAQARAMASIVEKLQKQMAEYEALAAGKVKVVAVDSFDELPRAFIEARIAAGLSQKELAEKMGLREQQIQRYEATEYASASFSRVRELIKALGVRVHEEVFLPDARRKRSRRAARS